VPVQFAAVVAIAIAGAATLGTGFLVGMRTKSPLVQRPIIWMSKRFVNPQQMQTAGTPGASASVIRSIGRRTGTPYQTPVGIVAAGEDFVIALPYGTRPNWLRNVLAAGSATIMHEGHTYPVAQPEIVPMSDVESCFSAADQRSHRLFGVDRCLRLRRAAAAATTA
jgi:deazaflavin-dependent oxidoreductase (nitroreductase family)